MRWPVALFLIGLIVPWVITVGTLRLSIYRLILIVLVLPCLIRWLSGNAGRIRTADVALVSFWSWCAVSFVVNHGLSSSIEPAGIGFVETLGAYFLARCYIRTADDFYNMVKLLFRLVIILLPFAIFEFISGYNLLRSLFASVLPTNADPPMPPRLGFTRVQSVFDHPILYGAFCASILALTHLVVGHQEHFLKRLSKTGVVGLASFISLSAGPLVAIVTQGILLAWNGALANFASRWKWLIAISVAAFVVIELVANRSALTIVVSYLLFDPGSYWFRRLIWVYGSASVLAHPVFGIGLSQWARPEWMSSSIDNFWLLLAVKHGLLAPFFLLLSFFFIVLPLSLRKDLDPRLLEFRTSFLIAMTAYLLVGWTVHFWDTAYVLFLFLMGSGVWLLDPLHTQTTDTR